MNMISFTQSEMHEWLANNTNTNISILDAYAFTMQRWNANRSALVVAYSALFLIGMTANGYVACLLVSILRLHSAETPRSIRVYIFALCCCDLYVLTFVPFVVSDLMFNRWVVPSAALCQLYLNSESVNKFCSPFILAALSFFCYTKICRATGPSTASARPILMSSKSTLDNQFFEGHPAAPVLAVLVCAALAFILVTPVYIYGDLYFNIVYNETTEEVVLVMAKCAFHPPDNVLTAFTVYSFIFGYLAPAGAFTLFYLAVVRKVDRFARRQSDTTMSYPAPEDLRREQSVSSSLEQCRRRRPASRYLGRATKVCLGLIVFYLVCWTPYWTMNLVQYFFGEQPDDKDWKILNTVISYLVHLLPYTCNAGYPILHLALNRNIRRDCRRVKERRRQVAQQQMTSFSDAAVNTSRRGRLYPSELREETCTSLQNANA